jgi:hypothetical protein
MVKNQLAICKEQLARSSWQGAVGKEQFAKGSWQKQTLRKLYLLFSLR